jgi:hypothetical protein
MAPCNRALHAHSLRDVMLARLSKLCTLPAIGSQNPAVALAIVLTLSAGHRPPVAQAITEFPVPSASSEPIGITTGPDGALWFNEYSGNKIGRITTAGVVTEFSTPTAQQRGELKLTRPINSSSIEVKA